MQKAALGTMYPRGMGFTAMTSRVVSVAAGKANERGKEDVERRERRGSEESGKVKPGLRAPPVIRHG